MNTIGTENGVCARTAEVWQMVGIGLMVFKIVIPLILIIIGIITLGKAVISDDEKDVKKSFSGLLKKFIVAVCIFFVPNIVTFLFGIVNGFNDLEEDYNVCEKCIVNPRGEVCTNAVNKEIDD